MAFSCGARSASKLKEQGYLRNMLSRRQLQALVGWRSPSDDGALSYQLQTYRHFAHNPEQFRATIAE